MWIPCFLLKAAFFGSIALGGICWPWEKRSPHARRMMSHCGLVAVSSLLAAPAVTWWQGHWRFGPSFTPVAIGTGGIHPDGCTFMPESTDAAVIWWCLYVSLGVSLLAYGFALRGLMRSRSQIEARKHAIEQFKGDVRASALLPPGERVKAEERLNAAFVELERFCMQGGSKRRK